MFQLLRLSRWPLPAIMALWFTLAPALGQTRPAALVITAPPAKPIPAAVVVPQVLVSSSTPITRNWRLKLDPGTGQPADGKGTYAVVLHTTNPSFVAGNMTVQAEGRPVVLTPIEAAVRSESGLAFMADVPDGILNLTLIGNAADPAWLVRNVQVAPAQADRTITFIPDAPVAPGQVASFTSNPLPGKVEGSLISVFTNLGVIRTADADAKAPGLQIPLSKGVAAFQVEIPPAPQPSIITNAGSGFAVAGDWSTTTRSRRPLVYSQPGAGTNVATWTFNGLTPGATYQVAATWPAQPHAATNAPFTIREAVGGVPDNRTLVNVNQQLPPDDFLDQGAAWEVLATVSPATGSLLVELSNAADGAVVASAVCVQPVASPAGGLVITAIDPASNVRGTSMFPIHAHPSKFDLSASAAAPPGYTAVFDHFTTYNMAKGYGWLAPAGVFDRGADRQDLVLRDGHYSSADNVFLVQLAPGEDYMVTLRFWDTFARDGIQVYVEGEQAPQAEIARLAPGVVAVQSFVVTGDRLSGDGMLDLRFHDTWSSGAGGDPFWIINAIEISRIELPPAEQLPTSR